MRYGLGRYGFDPAQPYFTSNANSTRLFSKEDSHTAVVLQRSIASRTNGRERRMEWIAGKNIEASFAEIPAAGHRCHGQVRAGQINLNTFFPRENPILIYHGEREISRTRASR